MVLESLKLVMINEGMLKKQRSSLTWLFHTNLWTGYRNEQKNVALISVLQIELEYCFQANATLNYH